MASFQLISFTSIILLLFFISSSPTFAGMVKDAEGEILQNGLPYYFLPYEPGVLGSGGLSWTPNNSSSCPLYVKPKRYSRGTPASISTLILPTFVPTSYPVFLTFYDSNAPCTERLGWQVTPGEASDDQLLVTAGTSGPFVGGDFQIVEADTEKNEYYIKYCRRSFESRIFSKSLIVQECDELGFQENGLLGVTPNKPVPFRFVKAFSDLRMPLAA